MRALRLLEWKTEPVVVDVPEPEPGPGEVVVRIGGSGACHSDLHLMHDVDSAMVDAGLVTWSPPVTLGHENAGWVHRLGRGVRGFEIGQPVAVYGPWGCGECRMCLAGAETHCEDTANAPMAGGGGGLGLDGGMAEFMVVPGGARRVFPLPDGLAPVDAAPLTDAALTPYHVVRRCWPLLNPLATAVVIGCGGLGHLAVQAIKATTAARVIAVDAREDALETARRCGADITVLAGPQAAAEIKDMTKGLGAQVVIDFVGVDSTLELGRTVVRELGDFTLIGVGGGSLDLGFFTLPYGASFHTNYWGTRPELAEVLELAARGMLTATKTVYSLEDAPQAYRDLEAGKLVGRAVVVP